MTYAVKDSGKRQEFDSGMVRDTTDGKVDYLLLRDGPMYRRWATHLTKGATKYAPRNWLKASGRAELDRFRESAARHFEAWLNGERDEDHAAAVIFNINGAEYVEEKLSTEVRNVRMPEEYMDERAFLDLAEDRLKGSYDPVTEIAKDIRKQKILEKAMHGPRFFRCCGEGCGDPDCDSLCNGGA